MKKIYIAAAFQRREEMQQYAVRLRQYGHDITSSWVNSTHEDDEALYIRDALCCMQDVMFSDVLLNFTGETGRGGRHAEFGMGVVLGKELVIIGEREHVFHFLPGVRQYDTFGQYFLQEIAVPQEGVTYVS